jgi:prevent-host-death family protein
VDKVEIRELKNRLSHYLEQVRAGHPIQIIDRGEVIAEVKSYGWHWVALTISLRLTSPSSSVTAR